MDWWKFLTGMDAYATAQISAPFRSSSGCPLGQPFLHQREISIMFLTKSISSANFMSAIIVTLSTCQNEGPVEKAGKAVNYAGDNIPDAVKDERK